MCEKRIGRKAEITDGSITVRFPICTPCHDQVQNGEIEIDKPTALMLLERLKERGLIDDYEIDLP